MLIIVTAVILMLIIVTAVIRTSVRNHPNLDIQGSLMVSQYMCGSLLRVSQYMCGSLPS